MFIIGIDPHRRSHAAVAIDAHECVQATLEVSADRHQRQRLLDWASGYAPRTWAIEGAAGTGSLLAQQLVAAGERVIDVPPKLAARVRMLDNEQSDKSDRHDARSVAIAALRKHNLHEVTIEDHVAVLRLLAKRHHDLVGARTRTVCRLHSTLCYLAESKFPLRLRADQAANILARIQPSTVIAVERKALARELLVELRRHDRDLAELAGKIRDAVKASGTTVTDVHGVGPIMAAYIIGHTGNSGRFPSSGHYARYNATAPISASTSANDRHRLNPYGNRQLNHAIHIAAVTQAGHDTPDASTTNARSPKATAARKPCGRSSGRFPMPCIDASSPTPHPPDKWAREDKQGRLFNPAWPAEPSTRHFGAVTPGPETQRSSRTATTSILRAPNEPLDTNRTRYVRASQGDKDGQMVGSGPQTSSTGVPWRSAASHNRSPTAHYSLTSQLIGVAGHDARSPAPPITDHEGGCVGERRLVPDSSRSVH